MYTISLWASRHVWPSRIAIVLFLGINTALGLFAGTALQLFQITIPVVLFYAAVGLFLGVFLVYPMHRQKNYTFRKTCDLILLACTFFFTVCMGNQPQKLRAFWMQPAAASVVRPLPRIAVKPAITPGKISGKKALTKKDLRQLLRHKMQVLRKEYKATSKGGKVALIILSVIVAFFLLYLIAAVSCNIACAGSEGLALVVAILGTSLVIFLLVRVIQRITRGPKHKEEEPAAQGPNHLPS